MGIDVLKCYVWNCLILWVVLSIFEFYILSLCFLGTHKFEIIIFSWWIKPFYYCKVTSFNTNSTFYFKFDFVWDYFMCWYLLLSLIL